MKLPHHRFLDYLLLLGLQDDEVVRMLELDDLVPPEPAELARARFDLADRPTPFRLMDQGHRPSQAWLMEKGVSGLLKDKPAAREALRILRSPVLRQPTEILLLGGHPPGLVLKFNLEHDLPAVSEDGVAHFQYYMWDIKHLATDDWAVFLRRHPEGEIYLEVLGHGSSKALTVADVFAARVKKAPVFTTLPGGVRGGGYIKPPPLFLPKAGPEPAPCEP